MCKPTASKTYPAHKPFTEPESRTAIVGVRITPMTTDLYGRLIGAIEDIRIELEFHNGDLPPDVYSRLHKSNRALKVAMEAHGADEDGNCKTCGMTLLPYETRYERIPFPCPELHAIAKELGVGK